MTSNLDPRSAQKEAQVFRKYQPGGFLRAFLFCILTTPLLFCGGIAAAPGQTRPSSGSQVAEARTLVETRQYDAALQLLLPLAQSPGQQGPERTDILFLTGLAATGLSQHPQIRPEARQELLSHAVAAYRAILINRPGLVRVRLELARVFFLKGDDALSRRHFEQVLASNPPPSVAANIRRFLFEIRARRRWSGHFGLSLAPDTNINTSTSDDTILINVGGQQLEFDLDDTRRSGVGLVIWGGGEYRYPLRERLRLRLGGDLFRREYKGGEFDETFVSAHLGPQWLPDANTEASLLASAWHRWSAGRPHSHALGGRLETRRRLGPRLTASARASWHQRDYPDSPHLDGPVLAVSLGAAWWLTQTVQLHGGLGYGKERPQSQRWHNSSRWLRFGALMALPRGFTVGGAATLRRTGYANWQFRDTLAMGKRRDRIRVLSVSVHHRAWTIRGFSPELVLFNETRKSNAQLFDYSRNRAEMRFVRQF